MKLRRACPWEYCDKRASSEYHPAWKLELCNWYTRHILSDRKPTDFHILQYKKYERNPGPKYSLYEGFILLRKQQKASQCEHQTLPGYAFLWHLPWILCLCWWRVCIDLSMCICRSYVLKINVEIIKKSVVRKFTVTDAVLCSMTNLPSWLTSCTVSTPSELWKINPMISAKRRG